MNLINIKDISIYMENNWITHSRERVFENPWLELYKHDVTDPGGKPGTYTTVEFRTKAVGIVPIDDEGNTWLSHLDEDGCNAQQGLDLAPSLSPSDRYEVIFPPHSTPPYA